MHSLCSCRLLPVAGGCIMPTTRGGRFKVAGAANKNRVIAIGGGGGTLTVLKRGGCVNAGSKPGGGRRQAGRRCLLVSSRGQTEGSTAGQGGIGGMGKTRQEVGVHDAQAFGAAAFVGAPHRDGARLMRLLACGPIM